MVNYWIALSDYPKVAQINERDHAWWYKPGRDKPKHDDRVIIYQPGTTKTAERNGVKIEEGYKHRFIGNFVVTDVDSDSANVRINEKEIIWDDSKFVDIYSLKKELGFLSKYQKNIGWAFWNKTWIPIERYDYDLILSKKGK